MQQHRNKPAKWGFKMWCRCAAKTGYLYEFESALVGKRQ